ncbi:hypothetical protein KP509_11G062700 [Ceratopteris richardii]|uniref:RING-CH-type domain-containing protein n=1 Tax=Ceratopteris richardii TaxID=49495 RepID=A0A8T2TTJ9_CERRI|nr:hypothetical protein KP509_11G062700 [Ceratopteris richardii]
MSEGKKMEAQLQAHVSLNVEDRIEAALGSLASAHQPDILTFEGHMISGISSPSAVLPSSSQFLLQEASTGLIECRICQEEAYPSQMEIPCGCSGTLKYAHHKCVQRWCNEKGSTICEICHQPYKQAYSVSGLQHQGGDVALDLSDAWELEPRNPRIVALAAAYRHSLVSEHEDNPAFSSWRAVCARSAVLILMSFLLFRHAIQTAVSSEDDVFVFIVILFLRMIWLLLPCYILVRTVNVLQQEQVDMARTRELSFLLLNRYHQSIRTVHVSAS